MTPPSAASVTSLVGGPDQLSGEAAPARRWRAARMPAGACTRAHARAAADEAAEVRRAWSAAARCPGEETSSA